MQVERTRMTVFSSTAEHFERLSRGLIPAVDLRLFWVCALLLCTPYCSTKHASILTSEVRRGALESALQCNCTV